MLLYPACIFGGSLSLLHCRLDPTLITVVILLLNRVCEEAEEPYTFLRLGMIVVVKLRGGK